MPRPLALPSLQRQVPTDPLLFHVPIDSFLVHIPMDLLLRVLNLMPPSVTILGHELFLLVLTWALASEHLPWFAVGL